MAVYMDPTTYTAMSMPKAINRTNPQPVDKTLVWNSLEALRNYAATDPVAYVGQVLSLVAYDAETAKITEVKAYIIKDEAGTIEEVGSATLGDDKTITLEEGVLSLNNWGKEYYKWVDPVGEEGEDGYVAGHHEKYEMQEGDAWPAGLEPKAATATDGTVVLAWYQPSTTTIEGVSSAIASVQNTVTELTAGIGSREDEAGAETVYGAINKVEEDNATNAEAIEALQEEAAKHLPLAGGTMTGDITLSDGGKVLSSKEIEAQIASAVESAGHLKRAIVDTLPAVDAEGVDTETIYMVKDPLASGDVYEEFMIIEGEWAQIGDTSVDLTNYVQKVAEATEGNLAALNADGALVDADVSAQDVADHLADEVVHITAEERTAWNEGAALAATNAQAIETLNGDANTVGSVANTANAAAAAKVAEIVADADADFDTLKEIADWILNDTTGAADMANDIAELQEKLEGVDTTVVERITTEINNALTTGGANKYALAADLTALATRVKTLEDNAPAALTEQEIDDAIASVEAK